MGHSYQDMAKKLASRGRYGDTMLVHMNPSEVRALDRSMPGGLHVNPDTGQPEAFPPLIAALAAALPAAIGGTAAVGAAAGTGLAGLMTGGSLGALAAQGAVWGALAGGVMGDPDEPFWKRVGTGAVTGAAGGALGSVLGSVGGWMSNAFGSGVTDAAAGAATDVVASSGPTVIGDGLKAGAKNLAPQAAASLMSPDASVPMGGSVPTTTTPVPVTAAVPKVIGPSVGGGGIPSAGQNAAARIPAAARISDRSSMSLLEGISQDALGGGSLTGPDVSVGPTGISHSDAGRFQAVPELHEMQFQDSSVNTPESMMGSISERHGGSDVHPWDAAFQGTDKQLIDQFRSEQSGLEVGRRVPGPDPYTPASSRVTAEQNPFGLRGSRFFADEPPVGSLSLPTRSEMQGWAHEAGERPDGGSGSWGLLGELGELVKENPIPSFFGGAMLMDYLASEDDKRDWDAQSQHEGDPIWKRRVG